MDTTYVWREWTGLTIPSGTNRIIVCDSCATTALYADYLDHTHEPPRPPATSDAIVGVYEGWHDSSGVDAFYSWLGCTGPQYAHEFVDHRYGWSTIGSCVWPGWRDWVVADGVNRRLTVSLPLLPESHAGQFAAVARGTSTLTGASVPRRWRTRQRRTPSSGLDGR